MKKLLVITPGIYFDPTLIQVKEKYKWLSRLYSGVIFSVIHKKEFRHVKLDNFEVHGIYLPRFIRSSSILQSTVYSLFILSKAMYLHFFKGRFDIIMARDAFKTGALALIISRLMGVKFIVEVIGNHTKSFQFNSNTISIGSKIKHNIVTHVSPFILNRAHGVKLLYQDQVKSFTGLKHPGKYVYFHDYVPISLFRQSESQKKFILLLGGPWFLKGVDILIKAFKKISHNFPEYSLKIVGWSPDRNHFERLVEGDSKIELNYPVRYNNVIKLMAECSLFVLPSRTEAMGCVLLEAMASNKPIIASRVDGIPTYIKHGYNGLLFEPENVVDLAEKMTRILSDENYAQQLAEKGHKYVYSNLSEEIYLNKFKNMIEEVMGR